MSSTTSEPAVAPPATNTNALMASLMGDGGAPPEGTAPANGAAAPSSSDSGGGLFDDIPVEEQAQTEILPAVNGGVTPSEPSQSQPLPPTTTTAPPAASSLLAQSGLLGTASNAPTDKDATTSNGGGGLFDDIDAAEQQAAAEAAAAEQERQRQAAEQAAKEQAAREQAEREAAAQKAQQEAAAAAAEEQRLQEQMHSIHLGNGPPPPHHQQLQQPGMYGQTPPHMNLQQPQQQNQQPPAAYSDPSGFYRDHNPPQPQQMHQQMPSNVYTPQQPQFQPQGPAPSNVYAQGAYGQPTQQMHAQQQHVPPGASPARYYQPPQTPNTKAGMYNAHPQALGATPSTRPIQAPRPTVSIYGKITVSDPLLINSRGGGMFGLGGPPHWSYQVTAELKGPPGQPQGGGMWLVRRRFRHVVALEERLRQECPGAILPPRPDKHATRAIEEASAQQSAEFAVQRAAELEVYLNQLAQHPVCHASHVLRLFLSLQDDMGTAWPEVSSNALTRLANVGKGAAVQLSESTATTKLPWQENMGIDGYAEDNAELLALFSGESVRMGAVLQAVPKLEGAVTLLREEAEQTGHVGMEISRLSKELVDDRELAEPFDIVSNGMLRAGRRSKRLALELSTAMNTFSQQYKLCRYEKMAFMDRKMAIIRRSKERGRADQRAAQLIVQQRNMYQQPYGGSPAGMYQQPYGPGGQMDRMERDAVVSDEIAVDAVRECEEIGERLKLEVNRIAWQRRTEWNAAVKVVASAMKEATSERLAIWESVREQYLQAYPDYRPAEQQQSSQPHPQQG